MSLQELCEHPAVQTWLHQHGYNVIQIGFQMADMVKIGFLSRVRGFTYRDDLQDCKVNSEEWKATPFHFRMYLDTFVIGAKGKVAYVLMNDVDRPSIDIGINFFQKWHDRDQANSPNDIQYLFLPLYKKLYKDDERQRIVIDHEHYTGNDSVVVMRGLNPLETIVELHNGMYTTIRKLLLAIPTPGTSTGKLFIQVERQAGNDWLICCFQTQDAAKVTPRLATLEDSIKKYVRDTSHSNLFSAEHTLIFNSQAAPIKGRPRLPRVEVPKHVSDYTLKSLQKLYTPTSKRLAAEIEVEVNDRYLPPNVTPINNLWQGQTVEIRNHTVQSPIEESSAFMQLQQAS